MQIPALSPGEPLLLKDSPAPRLMLPRADGWKNPTPKKHCFLCISIALVQRRNVEVSF